MIELCCEYLSVRCIWLYSISCHIHVWEQVCTLQLPECQGTPCSKQTQCLKLKWQQQDSNLEFTLKNLYDMIITHSQMHHTTQLNHLTSLDKTLSVHLQTRWLCVQIQSSFRYCTCFEQVVPWHSGNCRVQIHLKYVHDMIIIE